MKNKTLFSFLILCALILTSCFKSHECVGKWNGEFKRQGQNVWEKWEFVVNNDGTCSAKEVGSGDANYQEDYEGTWSKVSDDVIRLDLQSGLRTRRFTDGMGGTKYRQTHKNTRYFIRSDGAASPFENSLDNPEMRLK